MSGATQVELPTAVLSPCQTWRYVLRRRWGDGPTCGFILLNPSTADEVQDDPTIRRCIGYAKAWGYAGLVLGNIFALRSTDPKALYTAADPVGPDNDVWLARIAHEAGGRIVCGWGAHGAYRDRGRQAVEWLRASGIEPLALKLTGAGQPGHPLYLRADLEPFALSEPRS